MKNKNKRGFLQKISVFEAVLGGVLIFLLLICSYWLGSFYGRPPLKVFKTPLIEEVISESSKINGDRVISLINEERGKKGLSSLIVNNDLVTVAYLRAKNILNNQDFSHEATISGEYTYEKLAKDMGLFWRYRRIGENLARMTGGERDLVNAWLLSKSHRGLVLGDYDDAGIYSVDGELGGFGTTVSVLIVGKR